MYKVLGSLALSAVVIGQLMLGAYDDDHDKPTNALLPIGLALTAIGLILLAVLALTVLAELGRRAARRDDDDSTS